MFDPEKRVTPNQALGHTWILEGLPENLQQQHLKLIEGKSQDQAQTYRNQEEEPRQSENTFKYDSKTLPLSLSNSKPTFTTPGTASQIKPLRSSHTQHSLGDLTSIYQKNKVHFNPDGTQDQGNINITVSLNKVNSAKVKSRIEFIV